MTTPSVADANFDNISLFEQFSGQTQQEVADHAANELDKDPVFFLPNKNNTYKFRFYPTIILDKDTQQPKLQLTRIVWNHSGFEKMRRIPCQGKDCPVCAETKRLKDAKYAEAWRFVSKREAVAIIYVYESNVPKDYKYLKLNEYGYAPLRNRWYNSLNAFLATLTPAEMRQVLNPKVEAPRLVLTLGPGSDGAINWSFDLRSAALPPLPEGFKDVNDVYVRESEVVTDDELKEIRKQINIMLAKTAGQLINPDDDGTISAAAPKQQASSAVAAALAGSGTSAQTTTTPPECPGLAEGLKFGESPLVLRSEQNVTCLCCALSETCDAATAKK